MSLTLLFSCHTVVIFGQDFPFKNILNSEVADTFDFETSSLSDDIDENDIKFIKNFEDEIKYSANDSSWIDLDSNIIHLFGLATLDHKKGKLIADYIRVDLNKKEATARMNESSTKKNSFIQFEAGKQKLRAKSLRFNFESNKGLLSQAIMQQGNLYIHGAKTKFILNDNDSIDFQNIIYNKNSLVTSCDADHPHFGIKTFRLKIVPNRLAVLGPSNLELGGIPTPLFLPFAFIPMLANKQSGLILPTNFGSDRDRGLKIQGLGYYYIFNDYMDIKITSDFYTRGSINLNTELNYKKRYKYSGNFNFGYTNNITQSAESLSKIKEKSYKFRLSHSQDSKAHPYRRLSGNIDISFNNYDRKTIQSPAAQLNTRLTSNFYYSHQLPGTPFNLDIGLNHNQDLASRQISITFPDVKLSMKRIYPFKKKVRLNKEKWYEKINIDYNVRGNSNVSSFDSILFKSNILKQMRTGISHKANISSNYNLMKYFNFSQSINYNENQHLQRNIRSYYQKLIPIDTIGNEIQYRLDTNYSIRDTFQRSFYRNYDFSMQMGINTTLYGAILFKKGWLRGIKHTLKPSISLNFSPSTDKYKQYYYTSPTDTIADFYDPYSYTGGVGSVGLGQKNLGISYSLNNTFEAKFYNKRKEEFRKVTLLQSLSLSGNYNFVADSLKWSPVRFNTNINIFKSVMSINISGSLDPYKLNDKGSRINKFVVENGNFPLRLHNLTISASSSFGMREIIGFFKGLVVGADTSKVSQIPNRQNGRGNAQNHSSSKGLSSLSDLLNNFSISYNLRYSIQDKGNTRESRIDAHSIALTGSVQLTQNMGLSINNISYDFVRKEVIYPSFSFTRKLHCWDMSFTYAPSSKYYNFFIGVSGSPFNNYLKYQKSSSLYSRYY